MRDKQVTIEDGWTPDEDQLTYISSSISSCQVVIAGPGSGKTTAAVQRARQIDAEIKNSAKAVDPPAILFISFSRTSIRAALESIGTDLRDFEVEFQAQTIDSLAYEICRYDLRLDARTLENTSFSDRLRFATNAAAELKSDLTYDLRHVFIDEAQDISPAQAIFLGEYIRHLPADCGVTVFADPDQEIYRFLGGETEPGQPTYWENFLRQIEGLKCWQFVSLRGQYRAQTPTMHKTHNQLAAIRQESDKTQKLRVLDSLQSRLPTSTASRLAEAAEKRDISAALLSRTNLDVLLHFDNLSRLGRRNLSPVTTGTSHKRLPRWVAEVWPRIPHPQFNSVELAEALETAMVSGDEWESIEELNLDFPRTMSWEDVYYAHIFSDSHATPRRANGQLIMSTVHQSKGLEFDIVGVTDPSTFIHSTPIETEVLFVALSRAKNMTYSIPSVRRTNTFYEKKGNRWICGEYRGNRRVFSSLSLADGDIWVPDALSSQCHEIISEARTGDLITFERISTRSTPSFRCILNDNVIGETSPDLGEFLQKLLPRSGRISLGDVPIGKVSSHFIRDTDRPRPILIPSPLGFAEIEY